MKKRKLNEILGLEPSPSVTIRVDDYEERSIDDELESDDSYEYNMYATNSQTQEISFIEFAIINSYLHSCFNKKKDKDSPITVNNYGQTDSISRINFGGAFDNTHSYWFMCNIKNHKNTYIIQTKMFTDNRNELVVQLHISVKKGINGKGFHDTFNLIKSLAFNNSEFKGKCIKIKLRESSFRGIEIIDFEPLKHEIILNKTQAKYLKHFVTSVGRDGHIRYLLNGEPGTGKTESIREIVRKLIPNVTFIIPDFTTSDDLTSILEACEIFERGVIIMDDIDLYLGSRDNGSYTRLLGQFLSFFDGVRKRKISLIASTNDKGLVDKAAERPGRFNFTLDYSFLEDEQIVQVCNIHLPVEWQVEEVYNVLKGSVGGKKANITGAFISNLAENIKEMSQDEPNWSLEDTINLITESYKGFYSSQLEKNKSMGFIK
jgi:hypothetical protein